MVVNSYLAIFLGKITTGLVGWIISTSLIVFFGEILPMSLCCKDPLYIGSKSVYLVYILIYLLYIITYPVSLIVD